MWPNPQETADLVTFTDEILNGKLYFFVQWVVQWMELLILGHIILHTPLDNNVCDGKHVQINSEKNANKKLENTKCIRE